MTAEVRRARDGKQYTKREYITHYGPRLGAVEWTLAYVYEGPVLPITSGSDGLTNTPLSGDATPQPPLGVEGLPLPANIGEPAVVSQQMLSGYMPHSSGEEVFGIPTDIPHHFEPAAATTTTPDHLAAPASMSTFVAAPRWRSNPPLRIVDSPARRAVSPDQPSLCSRPYAWTDRELTAATTEIPHIDLGFSTDRPAQAETVGHEA